MNSESSPQIVSQDHGVVLTTLEHNLDKALFLTQTHFYKIMLFLPAGAHVLVLCFILFIFSG